MERWWAASRCGPTWRAAAAVLTGLLYACCFPPFGCWPLGWVALIPLLAALRGAGPAAGAALGLLAGFTGAVAGVHWLWLPLTHAYGFAAPAALAFLVGIGLYVGVFYAALGALHALLARLAAPAPQLWVPCLWVAAELARARLGVGLPWLFAGHTQGELLPAVQLAEFTGVYGVSFLVLGVNVTLLELLARRRWPEALAGALMLGCALGWGAWRISVLERPAAGGGGAAAASASVRGASSASASSASASQRLRVAVVQPAIPQEQKWDRAYFAQGMQLLYRLTREAVQPLEQGLRPELVIWPETALTVDLEGATSSGTLAPMVELLRSSGARLLLGAPRLPPEGATGEVRNSAALLEADGRVAGTYDKQILLPFGEYYPGWVQRISGLRRVVAAHMGELTFSPGPEPSLISAGTIPLAVAICYEATYPQLVTALAGQGARLLVNLTNDAWFEHSAGAAQHLAMTRLRAVEHRLPLIRAANTGISAIVAPSGRLLGSLGIDVQGLLRAEVPVPAAGGSFYTRRGDLFAGFCPVLAALLAGAGLLRRRRARTQICRGALRFLAASGSKQAMALRRGAPGPGPGPGPPAGPGPGPDPGPGKPGKRPCPICRRDP